MSESSMLIFKLTTKNLKKSGVLLPFTIPSFTNKMQLLEIIIGKGLNFELKFVS